MTWDISTMLWLWKLAPKNDKCRGYQDLCRARNSRTWCNASCENGTQTSDNNNNYTNNRCPTRTIVEPRAVQQLLLTNWYLLLLKCPKTCCYFSPRISYEFPSSNAHQNVGCRRWSGWISQWQMAAIISRSCERTRANMLEMLIAKKVKTCVFVYGSRGIEETAASWG